MPALRIRARAGRLGWVSAYLTQSHYTLGEQAAAIRAAERALEAGRALRDDALQIVAAFGLGQAHHVLGDYRAAQRHLGRAVAAVDGELSRERWGMAGLVSVASRIWLAASLADTGDFAEALARAREGVALAETPEHPWSLAGAYVTVGFVHLSQGHLDEAGPSSTGASRSPGRWISPRGCPCCFARAGWPTSGAGAWGTACHCPRRGCAARARCAS